MEELKHYRRLWYFVTVVTVLLVGITVTLNVMHAPPTWGARLIGGTPPVFVFFCIELVSRIPATSRLLSIGRVAASIVVSGLSFAISYQQQMEFIHALGFVGWVAYVYPVIIDGVMVVATLSLVEVTRKVRALRSEIERASQRVFPEMVRETPAPVVQAQQVVAAEETRLPVPVSPAPRRVTSRSGPQVDREVKSPLTGRTLLDRVPQT